MVKEWAKHMLYVLHFKKFPIRLTAEIIYNAISDSFFSSKKWNFRKLQIQENYNRSRHELKGALWIWIWKLYPGPWRIAIVWDQERQEPCHFAELETAKVDTISLEWHQKAEQEQLDTAPNAHGIHRNVASNRWKALYTSKRISVL